MLSPEMLSQLNELHCADLRRECEAERFARSAQPQHSTRPTFEWLRWPKLTLPLVVTLRRRHVTL